MYKFCKTNYYGKKINFIQMFKKVSYVNSNRFFDGNGKYIELLKNELLKEIPLNIYVRLFMYLKEMLEEWASFQNYAQDLLFDKMNATLELLADHMDQILNEMVPFEKNNEHINDEESLFVKVYFWILRYQCRCYYEQVLSISNQILEHYKSYGNGHVTTEIYIASIEEYIQEHKNEFLNVLVTDEFSKKDALDLLEKCPKYIKTFIKAMITNQMIQQADIDDIQNVPFSLVLASMFALRDVKINDEKGKNSFYHASKSGKMGLMSKINCRENDEEQFYQIYWLKKISIIRTIILHSESAAKSKIKFENAYFRIMIYLFSIQNMDDFKTTNERLLSAVRPIISFADCEC